MNLDLPDHDCTATKTDFNLRKSSVNSESVDSVDENTH